MTDPTFNDFIGDVFLRIRIVNTNQFDSIVISELALTQVAQRHFTQMDVPSPFPSRLRLRVSTGVYGCVCGVCGCVYGVYGSFGPQ
jgi:hypothetical protein